MLLPGYDVAKAAQVVVYFALKAGGKINVLKLAKLLYLAEREFMARYDEPMFYDALVSMPDGPVTSITLNLINGDAEHQAWPLFVAPRNSYDIAPAEGIAAEDLDDLSAADREVLEHLWTKFGHLDRYALRDWTHQKENIPEWKDPNGSSHSISHADVFSHLGKQDAKLLKQQIDEIRQLAGTLSENV